MDSQAEGAACDSCPKAITDGTRSRHPTWRGTLCRLASGLARVLVGRFFSRGSIVLLAGHSSGGTSVLPGKLVPCHWSTHSPTLWDGCLECFYLPQGFPGGSDGKESTCQCQETWVWSLGWEDPLEEGMATSSSILVWRIPMDRGAWRATVYGVTKSHTWLLHLALYKHAQRFSSWNNMWLPYGPVVESLPSNAGDVGLIPGLGTKIPHAPEQLNPCAATRAGIAMRSLHAAVKTQHKPEKKILPAPKSPMPSTLPRASVYSPLLPCPHFLAFCPLGFHSTGFHLHCSRDTLSSPDGFFLIESGGHFSVLSSFTLLVASHTDDDSFLEKVSSLGLLSVRNGQE